MLIRSDVCLLLQPVQQPPLKIPGGNGQDIKSLLWFVVPSEICLRRGGTENVSQAVPIPFVPKDYNNPSQTQQGHTHLLHEAHGCIRNGMMEKRSEKLFKGITKTSSKLLPMFRSKFGQHTL